MKQIFRPVLMVLAGFMAFSSTFANILYVKPGAGSSVWQEKSNVYTDLQVALASATNGDQIWVAGGTYKPTTGTDRSISFQLKDGVELYGGFAGDETELSQRNWRLNETILSGDIGTVGVVADNTYQVLQVIGSMNMTFQNLVIIDGVIIEKGYAHENSETFHSGGGLRVTQAKLRVVNTIIRECSSLWEGGGAHIDANSEVAFANTIFYGNCSYTGGALFDNGSSSVYNSLFYQNVASTEGAIYNNMSPVLIAVNSIFWENSRNLYNNIGHLSNIHVSYSCIQFGDIDNGNILTDPLFADIAENKFRLSENSPLISAGNRSLVPQWLECDFAGVPLSSGSINIGPFQGASGKLFEINTQDNKLFEKETTEVEISWEVFKNNQNDFVNFRLDYEKNNEPVVTVMGIEKNLYTIKNLNSSDIIKWRVIGYGTEGEEEISNWRTFIIKRGHPLYVTSEGKGDGTSWHEAMNLQEALNISIHSDQIWVAAGTYMPTEGTDRTISFDLKSGVELYGGFVGHETELSQRNWWVNETILSGDIGEVGVQTDNSYNVLSSIGTIINPITYSTKLDGFIVERGSSTFNNNRAGGGGLLMNHATPIISNIWFRHNITNRHGGAINNESIYLLNGTLQAQILNVLFTDNSSFNDGGAVYSANSRMLFYNCLFHNNYSEDEGGAISAMYSWRRFDVEVINSIAWGNDAKNGNIDFHNVVGVYSSIVQQDVGSYWGSGNVFSDPLLMDPENGNFMLKPGSPAIDAGRRDLLPKFLTRDFLGFPRAQGINVDMGPFERIVMANTMPANHAGAKESAFLGLEFRWGFKDGDIYDESVIPGMQYHIRVWESGKEESPLHDKVITPGGFFQTDYNTTSLAGFSSEKTYHWQIAMLQDDVEFWSNVTIFYIGHDHVIHVKEGSDGAN
ncbi:MAG TPA: choice-of-anchor Q domain-containing protein, partial [Mariniphaga sp.]|nr:choice-of-anchor Q domain-containing protein [Mariniphaga sp.]